MKKLLAPFCALLLVLAIAPLSIADDYDKDKKADVSDEVDCATEATVALKEVLAIPENGIPQEMLEEAAAIIVVPDLLKAALIAGIKNGDGVMSVRNASGWSHPAFVDVSGGSVGLQAGVESIDLILVFMSEKHVKKLLNGEFTLGADASVAIGPVGRQASAGTSENAKSAVYAYSRSKGAFAGISLDGSKISIDQESDERVYGAGTTANDVLYGTKHGTPPQQVENFKLTLNDMTKKSKS
ncbi:MAG: hypothetical protein EHM89_01280 [Acidobacteria bacterium]|jgi:lipid-binding SYLF domain-containing protein|nr:MAG: hypothetical protein EHM89_01280 [Acidobacteriota bacterium]